MVRACVRACAAVVVAVLGLVPEEDPNELTINTIATTPRATEATVRTVARAGERRLRE